MHVLITGSSGQIGTNLGLRLLSEGHSVLGVDKRLNEWTDAYPTELIDLTDDHTLLEHALNNSNGHPIDVVIHLGAHAKVYELVETPRRSLENVEMTFSVLEYCRRQRVPVIFGSSREVYGDVHRHITEEASADFVVAESPYSASKIAGEAFTYSYAQCYGLNYLVFRFSNVYGRYDNDQHRMERVIPLFTDLISKGQEITVYGREKTLDFTYVDDCVAGIRLGIDKLLSGEVQNQTINLAYGKGNTLVEVAEFIGKALQMEPMMNFQPSRPGEVTRYVADIGKAVSLLGYHPKTPLHQGIPRAIEWASAFRDQKALSS
ncbi:MAG: NAD-dependent epimerase/dehydratase family protein [Candidatus Latescibacteria bacterium]|nr:NAD-dependent epimerase/dehydratase family protein [Candidatus Latescibacterota bacterium]